MILAGSLSHKSDLAEWILRTLGRAYNLMRLHASLCYQNTLVARSNSGPPPSWSSVAEGGILKSEFALTMCHCERISDFVFHYRPISVAYYWEIYFLIRLSIGPMAKSRLLAWRLSRALLFLMDREPIHKNAGLWEPEIRDEVICQCIVDRR